MDHLSDTLLLEPLPRAGEYAGSFQSIAPNVADDTFSRTLRGWNLDPKTIMTTAREKTGSPDGRTSDEILQSWGMDPLPSNRIEELTADEHVVTYQAILAEAMSQLRSEQPQAKERKLWPKARRIADLVFHDGEYLNELGFRTEPDVEIPRPHTLRDRTQGLLQKMGRALIGTGPVATLQYYAGKAHAWFNDLPRAYKLAAGGVGISAVALAAEIATLDTASDLANQLEANLTSAVMPAHLKP